MLFKRAMTPVLALSAVLWIAGCGDEPVPAAPADPASGGVSAAGESVSGNADLVLGEASEDFMAVIEGMPAPAPGQWISYGGDTFEDEISVAVIASRDVQGSACLWYQFSMADNVIQVLVDQAMLDSLKGEMLGFVREVGDDPSAWLQTCLDSGTLPTIFVSENEPERILALIRALKMVRVRNEGRIMALDMTGVPELVERMIAENPELFNRDTSGLNAEPDPEFQEFMAQVQEAEFFLDHGVTPVGGRNLNCVTLSVVHPDEGVISLVLSGGLPIFPLAEISAEPMDPTEEGGAIYVTGFGFDGAEDLMPGDADQTVPAVMLLQSIVQRPTQ